MITEQISKILTQKENDWGRYEINSHKGRFLAVGVIPGAILGMTVTLEGREEDNKYGHQYKIQAVLSSETDPCTGIRKFLSDG
jgi:exodeoxyribonuclease V alpha subunit